MRWLTLAGFLFSLSVAWYTFPLCNAKFMSFRNSSLNFNYFFLSFYSGKKYFIIIDSAMDLAMFLPFSVTNFYFAYAVLNISNGEA